MSPQLVAGVAFLCFAASRAPGAYTALAVMEAAITALFFLLYLLRLDQRLSGLFWPLAVSTAAPRLLPAGPLAGNAAFAPVSSSRRRSFAPLSP